MRRARPRKKRVRLEKSQAGFRGTRTPVMDRNILADEIAHDLQLKRELVNWKL